MKKLPLKTKDLTEENIEKLIKLFPNLITEKENEGGELIKTINIERLKELIGDFANKEDEIYSLDWVGKRASRRKIAEPVTKTLRPVKEDSVDFENTENIYIEGDNFEVLKLLKESYMNKVKMIYIDPPYNTGKDFVYRDNFKMSKEDYDEESGAVDDKGNKLFKNTATNGRFHSDWISMMYERLTIARDLLKDDGVVFISIDDKEVNNLKKICDEIFGESNFIDNFIIRSNPRGNQAKKYTASEHEYILAYSKDKNSIFPLGFTKGKEEYGKKDEEGKLYREIGLRKRGAGARREDAPNQFFPIYYNPRTEEISTKKKKEFTEIYPNLSDGTDGRWRWSIKSVGEKKDSLIVREVNRNGGKEYDVFEKDYYDGNKISKIKSIFYEKEVNYENGTEEMKELFESIKVFDYPKPFYLIKKLTESLSASPNDIILDFFSGSATTAHAVMQLNAEDKENRKFIMVQLPEETAKDSEAYKTGYKNICEIGKERIRRAAKKIQEDNKNKNLSNVDFGFKVFKLDESNMKDVYYNPKAIDQRTLGNFKDNIKEDRTPEDLLYQVLLDMAIPISAKVREGKIKNKKVFIVETESCEPWLVACFDENVDLEVIKGIAEIKPLKVVFRDSSFKNDSAKVNCEEYLKNKSPNTILGVI
jgi:adenine-specific DNA-methyltransferase